MAVFESLTAIRAAGPESVGAKARALADLAARGFRVPPAVAVPAETYAAYLQATGLRDRVVFELGRKRFEDMRWEEIWDAALRIRNLFLNTPLPAALREALTETMHRVFRERPVVVRSSAPGEDARDASFAGLHESFVNIRGAAAILKHIRLVWASLWSDAALLYRRELGLDVYRSRMAVLVQAMAIGESSGVAFSRNPAAHGEAVIEAVHGLNAGLVDGTVEPDRWILDRASGRVLSHAQPRRECAVRARSAGIEPEPLAPQQAAVAPLTGPQVRAVYDLALAAEAAFDAAQDVEWTRQGETLTVLQSRPV
ncbi:MAG: PEP/pyruvate-binding domain-containing protein, partial [Lentisphaerae bacterium]|nr:PEP/pyruvate-binding domain-containing protein [Lentisphaerota bacterium]